MGLDEQERAYHVLQSKFVTYDGEVVDGVGLYVPKKYIDESGMVRKDLALGEMKQGIPSLRYLNLLRNGAREAGLCEKWIGKLDSFQHYQTPEDIRSKTMEWIEESHTDAARKDNVWTMETLAKHDGSDNENFPAHVCVMEYVVKVGPDAWIFPSWKGHCVTRRNLIHFAGGSVDKGDIRWQDDGFRPLPNIASCSEQEKEYLLQNLETLLHRGGRIVARLKEHLDDQQDPAIERAT